MNPAKLKGVIAIVAVVLIAVIAVSGFYRVGQDEEALVLTFGEMTDHQADAGLYWHIPLIQSVQKVSTTMLHTMEFGYRTKETGSTSQAAQYSEIPEEATMITGDSNIVLVEAMYQYVIDDAEAFLFQVDDPYGTLQLAFETVLRRNIQNKTVDDALLKKMTIGTEVLPEFQQVVDDYNLGISIKKVEIQNTYVPEQVQAAFQDVIDAMNEKTQRLEEAERYENEVLPAARADAYEMLQSAEGYKAEKIAQATGDVANFQAVYEKYVLSPEITRQRLFIETMERILTRANVKYVVDGDSGVLKFLPLESLSPATAETGGEQ